MDELLAKMTGSILNSSNKYNHTINRLKKTVTRAIWLIIEQIRKGSFKPLGFETEFGEGKELPGVIIKLDSDEKIILSGKIDRIDVYQDGEGTYLRIVDYKSGKKDFRLSDLYYGLQIQLVAYLIAVLNQENSSRFNKSSPLLPAGFSYFKIDDPLIMNNNADICEEEIEIEIMKKLRMKGLLLADVKIIKEMDNDISGDSLILPVRINKDGTLGKSSVATIDQFLALSKYVNKLLVDICKRLVEGDISIKPYKTKRDISCTYCNFSSVCQFDLSIADNKYKILYDKKDEDVWNLISDKNETIEGSYSKTMI